MMLLLVSLNVIAALACVALALHFALQRRQLHAYARSLALGERKERLATLRVAKGIWEIGAGHMDPFYLTPLLQPLGASPITVIWAGGCCSGLSRLLIASLHSLGIRSSQVTLYHAEGRAQHCLVEVDLSDGAMLVDPSYGLYYETEDGDPMGLEALQSGERPVLRWMSDGGRGSYPEGDYYRFAFTKTRTANWTKSRVRRAAYALLRRVSSGAIDRFRLHPLMEWPQVLLAVGLLGVLVGVNALAAITAPWVG